MKLCSFCNGSGEGILDRSICTECMGSGTVKEEDDEESDCYDEEE
jgi:DnaJ-class molecular chaperone